MSNIYRPLKIKFKNIVLAIIPLLLILTIFLISTAGDIYGIFKGAGLVLIFLAIFLFIGFSGTYIEVETGNIKIVKFFLFKSNIIIQNIKSLTYRAFGTKNLDAIRIEYITARVIHRTALLGSVNAYGARQISSILFEITKVNSSIQIDKKTLSLIQK